MNYPVPGSPRGIAVGAFTSSKALDIAVATADANVSVLIGNGDGTFQPQYTVQAVPSTGSYASYATNAIAVGDFNGDGHLDMAVLCIGSNTAGTVAGTINVLLGDGTGHFGTPTVIPLDGNWPVQILAGDFNNDSKTDLAVLNYMGESVTVLLGNGDGTFNILPDTVIGLSGTAVMAAADFNKDGKLDLAVGNNDGVAVLLGNGDGTFQPLVNWAIPGVAAALQVGDFNNDGNLDIAATASAAGDTSICVLLGQGNGSFQSPPISSVGLGFYVFATGDFNSDGKLDLASGSSADLYGGNLAIFLGDGTGSLNASAVGVAGVSVDNASIAGGGTALDINGDGYPDLIMGTGNEPLGAATVMLNCGLRCTNTAVMSSATSPVFNQPVTFTATVTSANARAAGPPTGAVIFQATPRSGVSTTLGSATISGGVGTLTTSVGLAPGYYYVISANYSGDSNFNSSTSTAEPPPAPELLLQQAPTTVVVSSSPNPSPPGQSVTFTATVTPSTSGIPTGTLTFSDNGNALVAQPLNASGVATFTTSTLSTGTHTVTGTYSGDGDFQTSTSAPIIQTVGTNAASFAVSASPASATVSAGASAIFTITLTTAPSLKSAVSFACSGLPIGASCNFSPVQITPQGASTTTMLTISTTGSGSAAQPFFSLPGRPKPVTPLAIFGLLTFALLLKVRKPGKQKAATPAFLLLCLFATSTGVVACGCNSNNSSSPVQKVTPTGTTQISVVASAAGGTQTTTVSLTIN